MIPGATVLVTNQKGRWNYLDTFGTVGGLGWRFEYPGGAMAAQCTVDLDPGAKIPALIIGAKVQMIRGLATVWTGRVTAIRRGRPWELEFEGIASLGGNEPVTTTGSLNEITDALITAGLPWTRPASLGGLKWDAQENVGSTTLAEVLIQGLAYNDAGFTVSNDGVLRATPDATAPTLNLRTPDPLDTTMNDFGTVVRMKYRTSAQTTSMVTMQRENAAAIAVFGRVIHEVNAGDRIITSSIVADQLAKAYLKKVSPRVMVTRDFACTAGDITTYRGARIDLQSVNLTGQVAQIQALQVIREAQVIPSLDVPMLIGATEWNADEGVLTVAPFQRTSTPDEVMFGRQGGGRTK